MNKYRIENPNSNNELDYKSSSTIRTNPTRRRNLLKNEYAYDGVGNITSINNVGMNPYHQEYNYDDTYQLVNARGNWSDINNNMADYRLKMSYSPSGKITNKTLMGNKIDQSGTYTLDHNTDYSYDIINPYAVRNTYDSHNGLSNDFDWDVKGNMIMHDAPQIGGKRFFCWTEDNRLQAVKDDKMGAFYNYDASGERNLKLTGGTVDVTQNGYTMNVPVFDQQTLYASALVTINDKGYTKHYFEEGKRICSKIGSGGLQDINTLVDQMELNYEEQFEKQKDGVTKTYEECMNITPHIKNENLYENIIKKYGQQQPVNPDEPVFFYHSDHLGSASYITDDHGYETQHLVYLPFGEDWVDMKYNTSQFETSYKFNGKEKDPETGYNYYGARYYYDYLSIFLSVDPMSDKYPNLSSYAYCANNPVMLIDPDGRDIDPASETDHIKNMRNKNHKDYNEGFSKKCKDLESDHTSLYRFNKVEEKKEGDREIYGSLTYGGSENGMDVININYSDGDYTESGLLSTPKDFVLFEETAHAGQFLDGKLGFAFSGLTNRWEGSLGLDLTDEVDAKNFAAKALGMNHKFTINNIKGDYNDKLSKTPLSAKSHHEKLVNSPIQYNSKGLPENPYFKYRQPK